MTVNTTIKATLGLTLIAAVTTSGCYGEADFDAEPSAESESDEIVANLLLANYPESEIEVLESGEVVVGQDAIVGLEASREIAGVESPPPDLDDGFRQYRTTNLVSPFIKTICIKGSNLTDTLSTGLNLAIANYNSENLWFSMKRIANNGSTWGCGAVIRAYTMNGDGGFAGFPSNGLPYSRFYVGTGVADDGVDAVEHVITHELGHCIGLRHSDYYNRSISCGSGGNEGAAGIGSHHIPGTPTTATPSGSIMNSCYISSTTGEWTSSDTAALGSLYADAGECWGGCSNNSGCCYFNTDCPDGFCVLF